MIVTAETEYDFWIGVGKTLKNNAIVVWIPALLAGLLAFLGAVPEEHAQTAAFIIGLLTYFAKNYQANK